MLKEELDFCYRILQKNSKLWCFGLLFKGDPAVFYAASTSCPEPV